MNKLITKWTGVICLNVFKILDNTTSANCTQLKAEKYIDYDVNNYVTLCDFAKNLIVVEPLQHEKTLTKTWFEKYFSLQKISTYRSANILLL